MKLARSIKNAVRFVSSQSQDYAVHAIFLFREGIRLFELKHYEEALDVYEIAIWLQRIALRINGSSTYIVLGEMLIAKGEVLFKLKRYQEVLDVYKQVRDAYMGDPQAYSTKSSSLIETAQSLYEKGCYVKSYAAYKRAILFDPYSGYLDDYKSKSRDLMLRSLDLYKHGRYDEAYAAYEEAITFNPDSEKMSYKELMSEEIDFTEWLSSRGYGGAIKIRTSEVDEDDPQNTLYFYYTLYWY